MGRAQPLLPTDFDPSKKRVQGSGVRGLGQVSNGLLQIGPHANIHHPSRKHAHAPSFGKLLIYVRLRVSAALNRA